MSVDNVKNDFNNPSAPKRETKMSIDDINLPNNSHRLCGVYRENKKVIEYVSFHCPNPNGRCDTRLICKALLPPEY